MPGYCKLIMNVIISQPWKTVKALITIREEQLQSLTINQEIDWNRTLSGRNGESMQAQLPVGYQANLFGTDLLLQLNIQDPLIKLSPLIPWTDFDQPFAKYYTQDLGAPHKTIRLMVGLLILNQLKKTLQENILDLK